MKGGSRGFLKLYPNGIINTRYVRNMYLFKGNENSLNVAPFIEITFENDIISKICSKEKPFAFDQAEKFINNVGFEKEKEKEKTKRKIIRNNITDHF